jgi:hypothetical protein
MPTDTLQRVDSLENRVTRLEDNLADVIERHTSVLETLTSRISTAIELQSNSLSVPLLRDILLPLVMKLFTFFSMVVLTLLTCILGLKWAFKDIASLGGG